MNRSIAISRRQELGQFISQFLKAPLATGSVVPSSIHLARTMTRNLNADSRHVVEYGPGTGSFTKEIYRQIGPDTRFTAVEINPSFRSMLAERYEGIEIFEALDGYAPDLRSKVDHVVSGLPFSNMSQFLCEQIIENIYSMLIEGGEFRTFLYGHTYKLRKNKRLVRLLQKRFSSVTTTRVVQNFPPAVVISCLK